MTQTRITIFTLALLLSGTATARAELITVDFNSILGPSSTHYPLPLPGLPAGSPVNQSFLSLDVNGMGLSGDTPSDPLFVQNSIWGSAFNGYPSNTTAVLYVLGSVLTINAIDGDPFSLFGMDFGSAPVGAGGARSVLLEGYRSGVLVRSMEVLLNEGSFLTTDLSALGEVDGVQLRGFADGEGAAFAADNIRIHRVSEPSTLLLAALGGVLLARRREQRRARVRL